MNLYIVRHGQTIMNQFSVVQGRTDIPLNDKGIEDAKKLKKLVDTLNIDVVISSPLKRAYDTAKYITGKNPNVDDRIIERNWGLREGVSIDLLDTVDCWNVKLNTNDDFIEPVQDLMARVSDFLEDIKNKYSDKNVLVVTHGAVMRAVHYLLNGIPSDGDLSKIEIPNLRIIEYKI
jgi:broad specificity phosphatase PhoE